MELRPYNITLHVYAMSAQEAQELENDLRDFVIRKYDQHVYPRAAALSRLIKRYSDSPIINAFIT